MEILIPILVLGGLGVLFGIGLAVAAKIFCVTADPRIEKIFAKLPGANCGACGKPGCMGFTEALIEGSCTVDKCVVSTEETREEISRILGVAAKPKIRSRAILHCNGGSKRVKDKFIYTGIKDCICASALMGGPKECVFGCIGYGTCAKACPFGAITMNDEDLPVVDNDKCVACGICVKECPKKLFSLAGMDKKYIVRCKSLDLGKKVMDACSVGCIACRKCEKACPLQAIKVTDNIAIIDYNICDNKGKCFEVCPRKTIDKEE